LSSHLYVVRQDIPVKIIGVVKSAIANCCRAFIKLDGKRADVKSLIGSIKSTRASSPYWRVIKELAIGKLQRHMTDLEA